MPKDRYYYQGPLVKGKKIELATHEAKHLVKVMRTQVGDSFEVINGCGELAQCTLDEFDRRTARGTVEKVQRVKQTKPSITLLQALPRFNRLDAIIEKCTELGMTELHLFPGEKSERKNLSSQQKERVLNLSIAAMKQCGRLHLPSVDIMESLDKRSMWPSPLLFGSVASDAKPLWGALNSLSPQDKISIAIGPEAGFTSSEEDILLKHGGVPIKLSDSILRTDTAPIAALAVIQQWIIYTRSLAIL